MFTALTGNIYYLAISTSGQQYQNICQAFSNMNTTEIFCQFLPQIKLSGNIRQITGLSVFCYNSTFQMVGSHICDGEFIFNEEKLNIITSIIASTFSWRIPTKTGLYQSDWARNRSYTLNNLSQLGGTFKAKLSVRFQKLIIKQIYGVLLLLEPVWYLPK